MALTYAEALDAVERLQTKAKTLRSAVASRLEETVDIIAILGGGAVAGYIEANWGDKELVGLKYNVILGVGLVALGIFDMFGRQSHLVASVGEGMLAYVLGAKVHELQASATTSGTAQIGAGAEVRRLAAGRVDERAIMDAVRQHAVA
jgi:hypothetical protein